MFIYSDLYFWLKKSWLYKYIKPIWRIYYSRKRIFYMQKEGEELLKGLKKLLQSSGVDFWLDFGTLLGAYRENDFIKHDPDIDIAIFSEDVTKLQKCLEGSIFKLSHIYKYGTDNKIAQITYKYKHISVDICCYYKKTEKDYSCFLCSYLENYSIPCNGSYFTEITECIVPFEGLIDINFKGNTYKIPKNSENYLKANYGNDFMIPNSNFDSSKAPNIIKYPIDELSGICYYEK